MCRCFVKIDHKQLNINKQIHYHHKISQNSYILETLKKEGPLYLIVGLWEI
jgi:hypothetical protein